MMFKLLRKFSPSSRYFYEKDANYRFRSIFQRDTTFQNYEFLQRTSQRSSLGALVTVFRRKYKKIPPILKSTKHCETANFVRGDGEISPIMISKSFPVPEIWTGVLSLSLSSINHGFLSQPSLQAKFKLQNAKPYSCTYDGVSILATFGCHDRR